MSFDPDQFQQMQQAQQQLLAAASGSMPAPSPFGPGLDPSTLAQAAAWLQAFQQGLQPGMPAPGAGFPNMPPFPMPMPSYNPGVFPDPMVRVSVEGMKFQYRLTEEDIHKVFQRYGSVKNVIVEEGCSTATVTFSSAQEAQTAVSDLDGKVLHGLEGTLRVTWLNPGPAPILPPYPGAMPDFPPPPAASLPPQQHNFASSHNTNSFGTPTRASADRGDDDGSQPRKFTCRFLIGIDNDKDFQVARRLIGSKGANMKRIVQQTSAKLRLRGVGSGYFEGAGQKESTEPLQLCVSCTSKEGYDTAVQLVTELLERIYDEYRQFCRENGLPAPFLRVNLSENPLVYAKGGADSGLGGPAMAISEGQKGGQRPDRRRQNVKKGGPKIMADESPGEPGPNAPSVPEIQAMINERNEARRSNKFSEADRIRDLLHSRGVALMDEPGGRGKGTEVTTWRYWRE